MDGGVDMNIGQTDSPGKLERKQIAQIVAIIINQAIERHEDTRIHPLLAQRLRQRPDNIG